MAKVSHVRVRGYTGDDVFRAVKQAMELAEWQKHVKGDSIFIKPNCLADILVPGVCTSPWVVESVIKVIQKPGRNIYVGDANRCTANQVEKASRIWGIKDVCRRTGAKWVNLSKQKTRKVRLSGEVFKQLDIPKILLDVDCMITIPVLKTHNITGMTCSMKNQWGCIPTFRHNYHLFADKCIPELNSVLNVTFAVCDATICLEDRGPLVGKPKYVGSVLASSDRVAMDSAGCKIMGFNPQKIGHIMYAQKIGLGKTEFKLEGDPIENHRFKPSVIEKHFIVHMEMKLRKIPLINTLIFKTPLFSFFAFIVGIYNSVYYYHFQGKKYRKRLFRQSALARNEFYKLIK